jgi:single stranded DNA-binding protein
MQITDVPVRLTADPEELKTTSNGKQVLSFNAAHNWRNRDESDDVDTTYFRCTAWEEDGAADIAALDLTKGALVRVSGRWSKRKWTGKDGQTRTDDELTVTSVSVSRPVGAEAVMSRKRGRSPCGLGWYFRWE